MTQINYTQNTFTKGIIDENLSARADTNFLIQGANDIVNMSITPQGTIEGRNGIVANKVEATLLNKTIDITTYVSPFNYKILNTSKYLIHGYTLDVGSKSNIYVRYSTDYGNTWDTKIVEFGGDLINELLLVNNDDYILLLARSNSSNKINIYRTNNCVDWAKIQSISVPNIGDIGSIKNYNNVFYFLYLTFSGDVLNTIINRVEDNGNYSSKTFSNHAVFDFYIRDGDNLFLIEDKPNTSQTQIIAYNYPSNSIFNSYFTSNRYVNGKFIKNNSDYFLGMINLNKKDIYRIQIINNVLTEDLIKSYIDKNVEKLIYNPVDNNWIIFFDNNTIEISNTNKIEDGTYIINNVDINNYSQISISSNDSIFSTTQYNQEETPPVKHYINLIGFKDVTITQQKNISVDDNLYSVIIYQNITTKERYLQLYNINNGNYIAYKFNLDYNNSLINENFNIISLIKLTDTQLLFTTSLAWYVIDVPKQKIEYNNDLRYFKITNEFRSRYGIQNYLFQATQPANPQQECETNFTLATIDKNKIKTVIDMDTCTRFLIINTDKNDKDGIIGINTRVRIHIEVPANNNVMLRQFWTANIYRVTNPNSFNNNNQTIFFCRGLYILTNDTANIQNTWDKNGFSFEVNGIVIDGANVNNELLVNYQSNQYGVNGSFDNGDIILFNNFNTYCYSNAGLVSFKPMYPSIINRFQNRLVCNNTLLNNYQIYLSKIGDEYTFFATDIEPASAFSFSLDGNERILQIETGKKFLISSINGNYIVSNPLNENLKPTNFNINKISNVIINKNIKPVEYDDKIFYIQNINNNIKFIVETDKIGATNEGIANISNMDIFKNATILDMLSCPNLNNNGSYLFILFIKNNKLQLSCCYSDKNQEILGWTKWESEIFNVNGKDLSLCKLIYHDNTLYISYQLNNNDNYILYFKLSKTELQDLNVLDVVVPVEQKVITTPISIIDPTIGNMIYKPYKLSNINVAIKNNKNNQPITIYCDDVAMNSKTNNIYELRDYLGNTGYLNKITFKVLSSDAKLELLGWQTVINYQGDTIK